MLGRKKKKRLERVIILLLILFKPLHCTCMCIFIPCRSDAESFWSRGSWGAQDKMDYENLYGV